MKKLFTTLLISGGLCCGAFAQTITPFKAGDRVVFLGNSITDGGHYHSYIWLYYMTHLPNTRITCFNAGIGGDAVKQMTTRLDADVLSKKPTVLTITWGMNDTGYFDWFKADAVAIGQRAVDTAEARYAVMDKKLKQHPEIKKIFILGSPYDETTKSNPKNYYPKKSIAFQQLIDFQEATAKRNGWGYVDFDHPMLAINKREQAKDSLFSLTPNDRIHPDNDGHLVMAYLFLKAQGFANQAVADFTVNAKNKRVAKAVNCKITNVTGDSKYVSFDYLANSLPYPLDTIPRSWGARKKQADALKVIPFQKEFNQELLTVKDLADGNYNVSIDDQLIGQWSAAQLAAGINLAEETNTPEYQQAIAIRELNEERWDIERRFRNLAYVEWNLLNNKGVLYADNVAAMDTVKKYAPKDIFINGLKGNYISAQYKGVREAWQKEMDVLIDEIYTINKPRTHKISIKAIN
jgi:lysophospholipase L1-like esterase